jgi:hypothetical protein
MRREAPSDVTEALEEMMPLVYEELRRLAGGYLSKERPEHTLQRTALVHGLTSPRRTGPRLVGKSGQFAVILPAYAPDSD